MIVPKSDIRNAVTTNATLREQLLKHPQLVAAYMQTAAMDFGAGIIAQQVRAGLELIAMELEQTNNPSAG